MATGGGAAYQRLTVPKDDISANARHFGAIAAQNMRQQRALNADKAQKEKEADEKANKEIKDKYKIDPTKYNITDAGHDDINTANMYLSREIMQRGNDLMREGQKLELAGNMDEAQKLYDEAKLNENTFQNEMILMKTHKENYDFIIENTNNISGYSKGYENFYEAGAGMGKIIKTLDEDGKIVHMTELVDENGNKQRQLVNAKDIINKNWRPYMKQDVQKDTTDIAESMGKIERYDTEGVRVKSGNEWDDGKENGVHTKAAKSLIQAKLGSVEYMSDMVDKFDLYKQFKIDEDNPPVNHKFTTDQKKVVEEKLLAIVKSKYDEKFSNKVDSSLVHAYKDKTDKTKDPTLSRLNYDADQYVDGDYTGILGKHEIDGVSVNIRNVIPAPNGNYVVAVTDDGEEIEIPNTKRGFLEFKIRNKPEYKGLTPEKVMDNAATKYRTGTIGGAEISAIAKGMFDEEGKPKYDDERFLQKLKDNFDITGEDEFTWSGNSLIINGKKVSTASQAQFEASLKAALTGGMSGGTVR